jgi:hypothetical protein
MEQPCKNNTKWKWNFLPASGNMCLVTHCIIIGTGSKFWVCRFVLLWPNLSRITWLSVPKRISEGKFQSTNRAFANTSYGPWDSISSMVLPGLSQTLLMITYEFDKGHKDDFLFLLPNSAIITELNSTVLLALWTPCHSKDCSGMFETKGLERATEAAGR